MLSKGQFLLILVAVTFTVTEVVCSRSDDENESEGRVGWDLEPEHEVDDYLDSYGSKASQEDKRDIMSGRFQRAPIVEGDEDTIPYSGQSRGGEAAMGILGPMIGQIMQGATSSIMGSISQGITGATGSVVNTVMGTITNQIQSMIGQFLAGGMGGMGGGGGGGGRLALSDMSGYDEGADPGSSRTSFTGYVPVTIDDGQPSGYGSSWTYTGQGSSYGGDYEDGTWSLVPVEPVAQYARPVYDTGASYAVDYPSSTYVLADQPRQFNVVYGSRSGLDLEDKSDDDKDQSDCNTTKKPTTSNILKRSLPAKKLVGSPYDTKDQSEFPTSGTVKEDGRMLIRAGRD